jgi:hypothetical protein
MRDLAVLGLMVVVLAIMWWILNVLWAPPGPNWILGF